MLPVVGKGEIDKYPIAQTDQMLAFPSRLKRKMIFYHSMINVTHVTLANTRFQAKSPYFDAMSCFHRRGLFGVSGIVPHAVQIADRRSETGEFRLIANGFCCRQRVFWAILNDEVNAFVSHIPP